MASNDFLIYYQNVRGLRTKCLDLFNNVLASNYDVLLFTETWLQDDVLDSELCDARYDIFRCDRDLRLCSKSTGGGVMICIRRELGATLVRDWFTGTAESVCLRIPGQLISSKNDLFLIIVYTPPNPSGFSERMKNILDNINKVFRNHPFCNYLLVGDFNLPIIKWNHDGHTILQQGGSELQNCAENLVDRLHFLNLRQYNYITNSKNNTLDLCFSNLPLTVTQPTHPLLKEDTYHPSITIDILDLKCKPFKEKRLSRFSFHKGSYEDINRYFSSVDWPRVLSGDCIDDDIDDFYNVLRECCQLYVPISNCSSTKSHYPVWYSRALIRIIKRKNAIHKKWKRYRNPRDYDEFSLLRDRVKTVQAKCFEDFTKKAENIIKTCPKYFWTYVKSKRRGSSYPKQFSLENDVFSEGQDICNAFNGFFESVFIPSTTTNNYQHLDLIDYGSSNAVSTVNISPALVEKLLSRLDKNKGAGCDGIPPLFLANCAKTLAYPIYLLFHKSLKQGTFPSEWKKSYIIPIHKKGSKAVITNYRPISIINTIAKVFEKVVYDGIYQTITQRLPLTQHGFLKGRSTTSNLALFTNYVLEQMEGGGQVDVIYTDFEKAFDRVDHSILIRKLNSLGIHGDLLRWITSYLSNRSQAVILGGYCSDFVSVPSGVPQGSHLGPLFYNAYIFDINDCFSNAKHLLYADDKKIFLKVNSTSDCLAIQKDLDTLTSFYARNNINISIKKCQCISFSRKKKPIIFDYSFDGVIIGRAEVVRDLGVWLDGGMSFSHHIEKVVNRSYRNLGFVIRTCKPFTSLTSIKVVYYAYVRSILEYASPIWSPIYRVHKDRIEGIQKKFLKHLNYILKRRKMDYIANCRELKLMTLEERRTMLDMGLLYDILHGRLDCPELIERLSLCVPRRRTRHTNLFAVPCHKTNYGQNAVLTRIFNTFNKTFTAMDPFIHRSKGSFKQSIKNIVVSKNG